MCVQCLQTIDKLSVKCVSSFVTCFASHNFQIRVCMSLKKVWRVLETWYTSKFNSASNGLSPLVVSAVKFQAVGSEQVSSFPFLNIIRHQLITSHLKSIHYIALYSQAWNIQKLFRTENDLEKLLPSYATFRPILKWLSSGSAVADRLCL